MATLMAPSMLSQRQGHYRLPVHYFTQCGRLYPGASAVPMVTG